MRSLSGLRAQILLWTILPLILILVAVSVGSITLHQRSMRDMVAERNVHLAGLAADRLDDQLQAHSITLETIQQNVDAAVDVPRALENAAPGIRLFDQGLAVYDAAGASLAPTPTVFSSIDLEVQQILKTAQAAPNQTIYRLISHPPVPWLLLMARTGRASQRTSIGAISQQGLNLPAVFEHVLRSSRTEVYLIAPGGNVIYHKDEEELGRDYRIHAGVELALGGETGSTFEHLAGDDEHVVGYAPVATTGWALLIEEPWVDVVVPGLQYTLWAPMLVLVAAIASLAALQFGMWWVIQPLQILGRSASRLAWGDFQAIEKPVGGIAEIRDLQSTLREMAAQIHRYQAGMQDYIAALTQTQEDERRRLARELHDVTVQNVIALGQRVKILQLDWRQDCPEETQAGRNSIEPRLGELSEMIGQCLKDVRGLIKDLRPIYLEELGLVAALDALTRSTDNGNVQVAFEVIGVERCLSPETNLAVYRIAQAAANNALRHADPDFIAIQLEFGRDGVLLTVEDDGTGFVPPERPSDLALQGHFGLVGMYERASRLGGHLSIRSTPGTGTRIAAFLPYTILEKIPA